MVGILNSNHNKGYDVTTGQDTAEISEGSFSPQWRRVWLTATAPLDFEHVLSGSHVFINVSVTQPQDV